MSLRVYVKRNVYYDSITLMSIAARLRSLPGIENAGVVMATPANYHLLHDAHLLSEAWLAAQEILPGPEDVLIVVRAQDEKQADEALALAEQRLTAMTAHEEMYDITITEEPQYQLPALNFRGTPIGIDIRQVVRQNLLPIINTGIAHRQAGIGQVGARIVHPPMACFVAAVQAMATQMQQSSQHITTRPTSELL
jgi:hypothetical protein